MANSSLKIKNVAPAINDMCPIKIYLNGNLIWDDDENSILDYLDVLPADNIVTSLKFDIVHFHHSICYIETESV